MTSVYLAISGSSARILRAWSWAQKGLGLLVSFHYLPGLRAAEESEGRIPAPARMLDSGAFSAAKLGKTIDPDALARESLNPEWTESVALDVIGDPQASLRNWQRAKAQGSSAMPTFHYGEPWEFLEEYKRGASKIALGGLVGIPQPDALRFCEQVFARAWPHRFHAFGKLSMDTLRVLPFHSADSSTWAVGPQKFGRWSAFGDARLRVGHARLREKGANWTAELDHYWRLQQELASRWRRELRTLEAA